MSGIVIRPMAPGEAGAVSALIRKVLLEVNSHDYPHDMIAAFAGSYTPEKVRAITAEGGHSYVADRDGEVVACASIAPWDGAAGAAIVKAVYVHPALRGCGLGRAMLETLEGDPIFQSARKTVVSASITAHRFYAHMGYRYPTGAPVLEEEDHYWLEKP